MARDSVIQCGTSSVAFTTGGGKAVVLSNQAQADQAVQHLAPDFILKNGALINELVDQIAPPEDQDFEYNIVINPEGAFISYVDPKDHSPKQKKIERLQQEATRQMVAEVKKVAVPASAPANVSWLGRLVKRIAAWYNSSSKTSSVPKASALPAEQSDSPRPWDFSKSGKLSVTVLDPSVGTSQTISLITEDVEFPDGTPRPPEQVLSAKGVKLEPEFKWVETPTKGFFLLYVNGKTDGFVRLKDEEKAHIQIHNGKQVLLHFNPQTKAWGSAPILEKGITVAKEEEHTPSVKLPLTEAGAQVVPIARPANRRHDSVFSPEEHDEFARQDAAEALARSSRRSSRPLPSPGDVLKPKGRQSVSATAVQAGKASSHTFSSMAKELEKQIEQEAAAQPKRQTSVSQQQVIDAQSDYVYTMGTSLAEVETSLLPFDETYEPQSSFFENLPINLFGKKRPESEHRSFIDSLIGRSKTPAPKPAKKRTTEKTLSLWQRLFGKKSTPVQVDGRKHETPVPAQTDGRVDETVATLGAREKQRKRQEAAAAVAASSAQPLVPTGYFDLVSLEAVDVGTPPTSLTQAGASDTTSTDAIHAEVVQVDSLLPPPRIPEEAGEPNDSLPEVEDL